ncbi:MAG: ribosomal-processing cysteine protease Prp [Clostridiales bacterium]|jgi:uncharacterized protein YsxB (DUF464 family)|nr:ribosomal-processing cysteine protease Prp [Clostridiales bacterium]
MITARFTFENGEITGFDVRGHSGYADSGSDIVCAAVSSAVMLCECAISDVLRANPEIKVDDEKNSVSLEISPGMPPEKLKSCREMLTALELHLKALKEDYPEHIEILEVCEHA